MVCLKLIRNTNIDVLKIILKYKIEIDKYSNIKNKNNIYYKYNKVLKHIDRKIRITKDNLDDYYVDIKYHDLDFFKEFRIISLPDSKLYECDLCFYNYGCYKRGFFDPRKLYLMDKIRNNNNIEYNKKMLILERNNKKIIENDDNIYCKCNFIEKCNFN